MLKIIEYIRKYRNALTIFMALTGMGIVIFYKICDTECSYLNGDILGVDLTHIGIVYILSLMFMAAFRQTAYLRALLAAGIGVEIHLIAFQFQEEVFCSYCLAFAGIIFMAFIVNYEKPFVEERGMWKRIIYGPGDVALSPILRTRLPLMTFVVIGYLFVVVTFSGSATPAYGAEKSLVPSYGCGQYEMIIFTDYFCPPCQRIESEIDPFLNEILSHGGVKVTFVDLPTHQETRLYAKYFLYAAKAERKYEKILHARRVLFSLAKNGNALNEEDLKNALNEQNIPFTPYNVKPVYPLLNKIINTHKVRATPTCVIKYSDTDVRKYTGTFEIQNGLAMLRATLGIAAQ